ncbi:MAG: hypothetical protein ACE5HU_00150 [Acidobacteriota bacterium]
MLPITETLGRRRLREIDPLSAEGRRLLAQGHVRLCYEDGLRFETLPIRDVLDRLDAATRRSRGAYEPQVRPWIDHHDKILRSIGNMKKKLKPRP